MSLSYFVGERPTEATILTVLDDDGSVRDLSGIDAVELVGDDLLPSNTSQIVDAAGGRVQLDWLEPFDEDALGTHVVQLTLTNSDAEVDYTSTFEVSVVTALAPGHVSPETAYQVTGHTVSVSDLARGQAIIGLAVGRDLSDEAYWDLLSTAQANILTQAISFQAVQESSSVSGSAVEVYPSGAKSVTTGKNSITFGDAGAGAIETKLAPLAQMALANLAGGSNGKTVFAEPLMGTYSSLASESWDDGTGLIRFRSERDRLIWQPL